jgi:hypothetical protein
MSPAISFQASEYLKSLENSVMKRYSPRDPFFGKKGAIQGSHRTPLLERENTIRDAGRV